MKNEESRPESDSTPGSEQGLKGTRWSPRRLALLWGALESFDRTTPELEGRESEGGTQS